MILARPIVTAALAGIALTFGSAPGVLTRSPGPAADPHCTSAHYWVTNRGSMLLLDGHLDGGRMILTATDVDAKGDSSLVRGIWTPQHGSVRETAQRSKDGGRTWEPLFDIVFRPHKAAAGR